jgi:hypothetical protein
MSASLAYLFSSFETEVPGTCSTLTGQSEKVPSLTGLLEISDIYGMLKPIRPLKLSTSTST